MNFCASPTAFCIMEDDPVKRAVKYCGGCNPRYDRVALVRQVEKEIDAPLVPAETGTVYDELYVICGCSARCAEIDQLDANCIMVFDSPKR